MREARSRFVVAGTRNTMIQITRSGEVIAGTTTQLEHLSLQFDQQHYVRLTEFLPPKLLNLIQNQIKQTDFYERIHEGIGSNKELCMQTGIAVSLLHFLLNNQSLFQIVQAVTRCEQIGSFEGRMYRVIPGCGHHDSWHDDMVEHRLVALSINLSEEIFCDGTLQVRDRNSKQILNEVANVGFGDAVIFRLAHHLEHRVTEVTGKASKTAFAGWFKSQPSFLSLLKNSSNYQ